MKRIICFIISLLLLSIPALSQETTTVRTFSATGTGTQKTLIGTGISWHKATWHIRGGTVSACSVKIEQSSNGSSWSDLTDAQDCSSNGESSVFQATPNYIRVNLGTFTTSTGTPLLTVFTSHYIDAPFEVEYTVGTLDHGTLTGLTDDDHTQYQKESEIDSANGYAAIDSDSHIVSPGDGIELTRSGSDNIFIYERTSNENALYLHRTGALDYAGYIRLTAGWSPILTATHTAAADPHTGYQLESEKDSNSGYAALSSGGNLLAPGPVLYLTRDGSEDIILAERTASEYAFKLRRDGATDFTAYVRKTAGWEDILSTSDLTTHESDTSTHGVSQVDGVTERNAAISTHAAITDAHHSRYTDAEALAAVVPTFVDRGDPSSADYTEGTLTFDGSYHDLDLSSLVPAGTTAILLRIQTVSSGTAGDYIVFRENGNSNELNNDGYFAPVTSFPDLKTVIVSCDSNRVIEYEAGASDWTSLDLIVAGYWK